ncbi:E3 ubiquitin/ISG15 ligase TRIM25-like [Boleophthalmus pectinirostris]|uniref:E3 ubiquitin/ISG15 ligase TRIM25-like n=1 Tax=Boleophthalmus pectinirostris TaxID=150288 RepID=UPI00242CA565|nr:E3 ubiquitin/ISG15 ligase TRIM25-like [Boleophthalmus pectinirostris]
MEGAATPEQKQKQLLSLVIIEGAMADKVLRRETLTCPICLDLLKNPVAVPCGHSFCKSCIQKCWPEERERHCCPQCRKRYRTRPVLKKNIMLADLVEQLRTAPPADHCAGPQDVACDVCSGERKLKAIKSCLQCVVSYCEVHLQPHHTVAMLQRHQLVAPSHKLQENICQEHNKVMELFCRTDQQLLCFLCSVDHHKGHDVVSCAAERARRQAEQDAKKDRLLQGLQDKDADLQTLQQEAQDISSSAQRAVQRSGDMFREIALLLNKRRSEVEQQILTQEKIQLRVQELQDQLQQEATELRKSLSELEELSNNLDHNQFILQCLSLPTERTGTRVQTGHRCIFENIPRSVIALTEKLQLVLRQFKLAGSEEATSSLPPSMPTTRLDHLLPFRKPTEMDPKTANSLLCLSEENSRRVTFVREPVQYQDDPERFTYWGQVTSTCGTTERSYWEVDVSEAKWVCVAVTYKDIERDGSAVSCAFGWNDKSWALRRENNKYTFCHNSVQTEVTGQTSSLIGVYLDHCAGTLCFYSVSETDHTMNLLHTVHTSFTQPLYAGVGLNTCGDTVIINPAFISTNPLMFTMEEREKEEEEDYNLTDL